MADDSESMDTQLEAEAFISPLKVLATEMHEVFEELNYAGFPEAIAGQIIARIMSDALSDRGGFGGASVLILEDDDEYDDDDDEDSEDDGQYN